MPSILETVFGSHSATNTQPHPPSSQTNNHQPSTRYFPSSDSIEALQLAGVPLHLSSETDCTACSQSCSTLINLDGYPRGFSIDTTTPLLGSVKPFDYLILCSTGKTDWPHDVCRDPTDIPGALRQAYPKARPIRDTIHQVSTSKQTSDSPPGTFPLPQVMRQEKIQKSSDQGLQVSILTSSHISSSMDDQAQSLIVLPDWVLVPDVTSSNLPHLPFSQPPQRLPHHVIILLCSHKTRDKRCGIAAPILQEALTDAIEGMGPDWRVDTRGDEEISSSSHASNEERLVGIFQVSHSGGHKFAGNMIINYPNGASVWYGRVTPSDCERIVSNTIVGHEVIPELLKGGFGLSSLKDSTLDW